MCTIIISILSIGEIHGVAVILLFTSLLWVMTPRTELKTSVQPDTVPTNWKGAMYRFSAVFGTLLVCIQSLTKLEIVSEQLCPVVNQTNRLDHSGVFGTYMCSEQLSRETFDGWSCPNELEQWTRKGPQIQFSELCPNAINQNTSVYTDLTSTEYCMLTEYRMFCSIYPTSTRNPTVEDLHTKDRLETTILSIFLLCCALLSTTEHWRYRLEIDARIAVDAVLEAEVKKRRSRIVSSATKKDTFGDREGSSRLFGSTITAFNNKKNHAPKLDVFRANARMSSMDEAMSPSQNEEKKIDADDDVVMAGIERPSRAIPQSPLTYDTPTNVEIPTSSSKSPAQRHVSYKRSRFANMVGQLQVFLPTLVVSLLVIGAWLHCNFVSLAFLLIALLLCCLRRSSLTLRFIFLLQLSVLLLIIMQYVST